MDNEDTIRRAQIYSFLASAFLYPADNWIEDIPHVLNITRHMRDAPSGLDVSHANLADTQAAYRRSFGITGSQCYETECGLANEFLQSQEMADIAGYYQAFGFATGGSVRERPDHIAVECEYMYAMAVKEAYAIENSMHEQAEICADAQRKFLENHLGCWIELFSESLARNLEGEPTNPYLTLARFAAAFVSADARLLGAQPKVPQLDQIRLTPIDPDPSCETCILGEPME